MSNEVLKTMLTRTSVKKYKSEEVPFDLLEKIIEAGIYAPSGKNWQAPIILAVTNKEVRNQLSKLNAKILGMGEDQRGRFLNSF